MSGGLRDTVEGLTWKIDVSCQDRQRDNRKVEGCKADPQRAGRAQRGGGRTARESRKDKAGHHVSQDKHRAGVIGYGQKVSGLLPGDSSLRKEVAVRLRPHGIAAEETGYEYKASLLGET